MHLIFQKGNNSLCTSPFQKDNNYAFWSHSRYLPCSLPQIQNAVNKFIASL